MINNRLRNALIVVGILCITSCEEEPITVSGFTQNGGSVGLFSVSPNKQVRISRGNLQYNAAKDLWRFAEHQYDLIGSTNSNISSTYDGWIDLFGWCTSGWNSGAICYQPWAVSNNPSDYFPHEPIGSYANADWGVYNPIHNGGNQEGMWRTMTIDEWYYLLGIDGNNKRNEKWAHATIDGVHKGIVLLPDDWSQPSGVSFVPGDNNGYMTNNYSLKEWSIMEDASAIFLPAAGERYQTEIDYYYSEGYYWSSSLSEDNEEGRAVCFLEYDYGPSWWRFDYGFSVRLIHEAN